MGSGEKDTFQQGGRDQKARSENSGIMVAVIKTGHSIHRIFNYNENKVKEERRSLSEPEIIRLIKIK